MVLSPDSIESSFCVVPRQDKDNPMLERIASTLVHATECLAREDDMRVLSTKYDVHFYASVVVTNATLIVAEFNAADVDLESGSLKDGVTVRQREWIS